MNITEDKALRSARPFPADLYFQTTEFTCGPAALMMAMAALDPGYMPSRLDEMKIWREANLIYMGNGHAGCGPHGLAVAAMKRGYDIDIYEHQADNLFMPWMSNDEQAEVQRLLAIDDRKRAVRRGCRIHEHPLTLGLVGALIMQNRQLITLTSKDLEAHWVILHDVVDSNVFIIDPYKPKQGQTTSRYKIDGARNFIKYADFKDWIKYGPQSSTVLIAVGKKGDSAPPPPV